jgi:hypothetical protein
MDCLSLMLALIKHEYFIVMPIVDIMLDFLVDYPQHNQLG